MILFVILGVVVLGAIVVLGVLFFMLSKEGKKEENAVPLTDLNELKKELSSGLLEPQISKTSKLESEIIPPFEPPKVAMPTFSTSSILEEKKDDLKIQSQELQDELKTINLKAEGQSEEAKRMIEVLTQENESLKSKQAELQEAEIKLKELQGEASNLKTENLDLQARLESADGKVRLLEEQLASVKIQMGEEINRANAAVSDLSREKEALISAPKAEPDPALRQELDALKSEYHRLIELNTQLKEQNESLQYELIKARAQSSGLEKVSFNYKNQLEDFLKKANTAQASNEHLSQAKNRLEGIVQEIKVQNEELLKKDQLAQFELEKSRSRLANLEREYEEFKVRVQQQKG